jgi:hypothetical protein
VMVAATSAGDSFVSKESSRGALMMPIRIST